MGNRNQHSLNPLGNSKPLVFLLPTIMLFTQGPLEAYTPHTNHRSPGLNCHRNEEERKGKREKEDGKRGKKRKEVKGKKKVIKMKEKKEKKKRKKIKNKAGYTAGQSRTVGQE